MVTFSSSEGLSIGGPTDSLRDWVQTLGSWHPLCPQRRWHCVWLPAGLTVLSRSRSRICLWWLLNVLTPKCSPPFLNALYLSVLSRLRSLLICLHHYFLLHIFPSFFIFPWMDLDTAESNSFFELWPPSSCRVSMILFSMKVEPPEPDWDHSKAVLTFLASWFDMNESPELMLFKMFYQITKTKLLFEESIICWNISTCCFFLLFYYWDRLQSI